MKVVLVYQAGIANVFEVDSLNLSDYGREARRLLQGDFRTCEAFARGCGAAGAYRESVPRSIRTGIETPYQTGLTKRAFTLASSRSWTPTATRLGTGK